MKKILFCTVLFLLFAVSLGMAGCNSPNDKEPEDSTVSKEEISLRSWSIGEIREAFDKLSCPVEDIDFQTDSSDSSAPVVCFKTNVSFSGSPDKIYSLLSQLCAHENENLFAESIRIEGGTDNQKLSAVFSNPTARDVSRIAEDEAKEYIRSKWACLDRYSLVSAFTRLHLGYRTASAEFSLMPDKNGSVEIKLSMDFTTSAEFLSYRKALSEDGSFELTDTKESGTSPDDPTPSYHADIILCTDKFRKTTS